MSKSKLRKEYEARMGVVEGTFRLYNAAGQVIYYECDYACAEGYWAKREYNEAGKQVSFENSAGLSYRSKYNRPSKLKILTDVNGFIRGVRVENQPLQSKILTDENGTQYKLLEITK